MKLLLLVGLSILLAGPGSAKVVPEFSSCSKYFYKNTPPSGFIGDQKICQKYDKKNRFATLYSTEYRIPIWAAYTLGTTRCEKEPLRRSTWFIEPQLTSPDKDEEMKTPGQSALTEDEIKIKQALSTDYEDTDYDRGHLNPNAFQCGDDRQATFTLTNAAPMDPCFNRIYWSKNEKELKAKLKNECTNKGGKAFLVTGTVPSNNKKIPDPDKDGESDNTKREFSRVSIPTHIWTAACCDLNSKDQTWFKAYLAKNEPKSVIEKPSVPELEEKLKQLYGLPNLKIFADISCNANTMTHLIMNMEKMALEDETGSEPPKC